MALSKCPVMAARYHHYLDSPVMWTRYRFTDPYWTRYHHEFERMRTSMMYQQDLIDEMLTQVRATRASRTAQSERINRCAAKCASITESLQSDARSIGAIEDEMASWQRAVSEMHTTMSSMKSKTETMGSKISMLRDDFDKVSNTLQTEFNIQALLKEMEEKRRRAEEECQRIYNTLNISKPKKVDMDSWCPICKSNNCVYSSTKKPEPVPEPEPLVELCPVCGSDSCTYGQEPEVEACPVCGSETCTYGQEPEFKLGPLIIPEPKIELEPITLYLPEPEPEPVVVCAEPEPTITYVYQPKPEPVNVCAVCGAENCQFGKGTRCKVCGSLTCKYQKEKKDTRVLILVEEEPETKFIASTVCEICGADNCTIGQSAEEPTVCDICFKENCPYYKSGSF